LVDILLGYRLQIIGKSLVACFSSDSWCTIKKVINSGTENETVKLGGSEGEKSTHAINQLVCLTVTVISTFTYFLTLEKINS